MANQLITHQLPIDYLLISLMSLISYVWYSVHVDENFPGS